jgi:hypothetical protein
MHRPDRDNPQQPPDRHIDIPKQTPQESPPARWEPEPSRIDPSRPWEEDPNPTDR